MSKKNKLVVFIIAAFLVSCSPLKKILVSPKEKYYVVIGCSAAGFYAAKELKKLAKGDRVICISEENSTPYQKTKFHGFIANSGQPNKKIELMHESMDIEFILGTKVIAINVAKKLLHLADGNTLDYHKLLIASGARPMIPTHLSSLSSSSRVRFYNSKEDLDAILSIVDKNPAPHVALVGAGIRALELADGLFRRHNGMSISLLNRTAQFLSEHGDASVDEFINKRLKNFKVNVIAPATVNALTDRGSGIDIVYSSGVIHADLVIFAMGTVPNSELARTAGLELYDDGSIKVDNQLKTNNEDIYAAGDVVSFKNPLEEGLVRSAKWSLAKREGQIAAANMVGLNQLYKHEPAIFSLSFFGMKALVSGNVRAKSLNSSVIKSEEKRYARYVLENQRLKSFIMVWDKDQKRPDISFLKRKLVDQSPVTADELLQ